VEEGEADGASVHREGEEVSATEEAEGEGVVALAEAGVVGSTAVEELREEAAGVSVGVGDIEHLTPVLAWDEAFNWRLCYKGDGVHMVKRHADRNERGPSVLTMSWSESTGAQANKDKHSLKHCSSAAF